MTVDVPPEYESIEEFVQYLLDEDRDWYDHRDLQALSYSLRLSSHKVRAQLDDWGLHLVRREPEREVRGYSSWDENRWQGNPCGGGSGWEQVAGFAGKKG